MVGKLRKGTHFAVFGVAGAHLFILAKLVAPTPNPYKSAHRIAHAIARARGSRQRWGPTLAIHTLEHAPTRIVCVDVQALANRLG